MKTFKTREIIKKNQLSFREKGTTSRKNNCSNILKDKKYNVPTFSDQGVSLKGHNELYDVEITKELTNSRGVCFSDGIHKVEMIPVIEQTSEAILGDDGKLLFQDFNGLDDLSYTLNEKGVKEEVIIFEKREVYQFQYRLKMFNLEAQVIDEEKIIFVDNSTKTEVFQMADLLMFDQKGEESKSITLSVDGDILTVSCNSQWINDEERIFPVIVDPQIEVITKKYIEMKCISTSGNIDPIDGKFKVGYPSTTNYLQITVDGNSVYQNTNSPKAKYTLALAYAYGNLPTSSKGFKVTINGSVYEKGLMFNSDSQYIIDITNYVLAKTSFIIKIELEEKTGTSQEYCYIYDYSHTEETLRPALSWETVEVGEAINTASLDKQLSKDDDISINLHDGIYLYSYHGPIVKDKALQVGVDFIHSSLKRSNAEIKDAHMGGLKTNLHQYIIKDSGFNSLLGSKKTLYIDGNNRSHELYERWYYETNAGLKNFIKKTDVFLDNDGKLKTTVNGVTFEVKYDIQSDDGLTLISATSLFNYAKKATKKIQRVYSLNLKDKAITLSTNGLGSVKMPHYTKDLTSGTTLLTKPDWHTKPTDCYNAASMSNETWVKWDYDLPINVYSSQIGTSGSTSLYRVHEYDLPILKDQSGYYVEIYNSKHQVSYTDAGKHEILNYASTPKKVYLTVKESYIYDEVSSVYENENLSSVLEKIKQIKQYLDELYSARDNAYTSIKTVTKQVNQLHMDSTRFQVQIVLTDKTFDKNNDQRKNANYSNRTQTVARAQSLQSVMEQRSSLLKQLGDIYGKIDQYEVMLANALEEKAYLIETSKDSVSDLIIDENGNALGFDYYGKLIMIQDKFEKKLEITYDENKLVTISGEKEKIEFTYNKVSGLLDYVSDSKGRKIFFNYSNNQINRISKEQKLDSKTSIVFQFTSNSNLSTINHWSGYMTTLGYENEKITNIKQQSYVEYIDENEINHFNYSNTAMKVIFNDTISYNGNKTTVTEPKNNQAVHYTFDASGRVINEENDEEIVVRQYEKDLKVLETSFDKNSNHDLAMTILRTTFETKINLNIGNTPTSSTTINKNDSISGRYVFLLDVREATSTNRHLTLSGAVYNDTSIVKGTSFAMCYDNPKNQIVALPIYIPTDEVCTKLEIKIKTNTLLTSASLANARLAKGEWVINEFDNRERLIKSISGKEICEYFDFTNDLPTRIVTTDQFSELKTMHLEYDNDGNLVYSKDPLGNIEETYFNELGQVIEKRSYNEEASSEVTTVRYKYDETGRLVDDDNSRLIGATDMVSSTKDDNGGITHFGLNYHTDELTAKTFVGSGMANRTRYKYTNNLLTSISHNGFKVRYKLDHFGRKLETYLADDETPVVKTQYNDNYIYYEDTTSCKGTRVVQIFKDGKADEFIYNKKGLLVENSRYLDYHNSPVRELTTYEYDTYGRLLSKTYSGETVESYQYHVNGEISKRTIDNVIEYYSFDEKQRIKNVVNSFDGKTTNLEYDEKERINQVTVDELSIKTMYDTLNRTEDATLSIGTSDIFTAKFEYLTTEDGPTSLVKEHTKYIKGFREDNFIYSYDKAGNITKILSDDTNTRYTYDKLNRLIREDNDQLGRTYLYHYDTGGNITARKEYEYNITDEPLKYLDKNTFSYALTGHKDRLIKTMMNGQVMDVTYDMMGRPLTYRGSELTWNKTGTLNSFHSLLFTYNKNGIRVSKGSTTFKVLGTKIIEQKDGNNLLKPTYLLDNMIGFEYNNTRYIYSKNIQGDISGIYTETGNLVASYVYDAWGNHKVINGNGTEDSSGDFIGNINPFRYRGYYYDRETKLYYLNSRYYDPEVGRFISPDIISILDETMMDVNGLNLYMYCGNNPVMRVDSNGYAWWNWVISGLQIAVGTILCATGIGAGIGAMLIVGGAVGIVSQIVSPVIGQIFGGFGSMANGWGAISTGLSLFSFGWIGAIAGFTLMAVGAATMVVGANDVVAGITGTNYIQEWTGMSDSAYGWMNFGLNVASSLGTLGGILGRRIASNHILNDLVKNPTKIQNYSLKQIKTYGKYNTQFNIGVLGKGNHAGQGYTLTHKTGSANGYIQWHPGRGHHGANAYFKITAGNIFEGTMRYDTVLKIFMKLPLRYY